MSIHYSKEDRQKAKSEKKGLITVSFTRPSGSSITIQGPADSDKIGIVEDTIDKLLSRKKFIN